MGHCRSDCSRLVAGLTDFHRNGHGFVSPLDDEVLTVTLL